MPLMEKCSTLIKNTNDNVKVFLTETHTWKKYFHLDTRLIKSGSHTLHHCTNSRIYVYTLLQLLVSYDHVLHSITFSKVLVRRSIFEVHHKFWFRHTFGRCGRTCPSDAAKHPGVGLSFGLEEEIPVEQCPHSVKDHRCDLAIRPDLPCFLRT
jgi:hypothetical protein